MEARVLEADSNYYLIQVKCDKRDLSCLHPHEVIREVRKSLSEKIAGLLFEKIEPKILEIMENNSGVK
ncbi:hypothetical protein LCGC14_1987900 [marine sediment metagenome]|uniref:Uncharacterized protein n=1 Tax=marine sediment metagenome TaxID=412755 RepID=A0A0F9FUZ8_9ZZZZ